MHHHYQVLIQSYDQFSRSPQFQPIQFNPGDKDSPRLLAPFPDESVQNEESPDFSNEKSLESTNLAHFQQNNALFRLFKPKNKHKAIELDQEPFYMNPERGGLEPMTVNNDSFSFANRQPMRIEDPHPKINSISTSERLFRMSAVLKQRKQLEIEENELKALQKCSFKPEINKKSSKIALNRSFHDVIRPKQAQKKHFEQEIAINKSVHEPKPSKQASKQPKIIRKSVEIAHKSKNSISPAGKVLINPKDPPKSIETANSSVKKVAERFRREFESVLKDLSLNGCERLSEEDVERVLVGLGLMKAGKIGQKGYKTEENREDRLLVMMWSTINRDSDTPFTVSGSKLLAFLLCVIGVDPRKTSETLQAFQRKQEKEARKEQNLACQLEKDQEITAQNLDQEGVLMDFSTEEDLCRYKATLDTLKSMKDTFGSININEVMSPTNNNINHNDNNNNNNTHSNNNLLESRDVFSPKMLMMNRNKQRREEIMNRKTQLPDTSNQLSTYNSFFDSRATLQLNSNLNTIETSVSPSNISDILRPNPQNLIQNPNISLKNAGIKDIDDPINILDPKPPVAILIHENQSWKKIQRNFSDFYHNRLMSQNDQSFKNPTETFKFQPEILRKSRSLADKAREKIRNGAPQTVSDLFSAYEARKKAKINSLSLEKIAKTAEKCTFMPEKLTKKTEIVNKSFEKQGKNILKLASPKFKLPARKPEEIEFENARKECTFKPNCLKSKATNSSHSKRPSFYKENKPPTKRSPFTIDVKLGEGRKDKILIGKNMDISLILREFITKQGLNQKQTNALYEQMIRQMG